MRCWVSVLALISLATMARAANDESEARPIEQADSVLAIYPQDLGLASKARVPALIVAIWGDGHIVWSKDRLRGGPPYYAGQIDPEDVRKLLSRLGEDGVFADKSLNQLHFGPDSHFTTLLVRSGKKQLLMASWHEAFEASGKTVAGSKGIQALDGQPRLERLRKEPADYLYYRFVWSETRGRLIDLIPSDGKPVSGKVSSERGLSWREAPADRSP